MAKRHSQDAIQDASAPYRVLLIDDHEPLAEATAEFLQCEGLEVRIASSGLRALEMATEFEPDIVLCDILLPDMSGLEVARILRAWPGAKNTVIAMHSARDESELREFARYSDAPVNMFLSKPLTKEKLAAVLSQLQILRSSASSTESRSAKKKFSLVKKSESDR